METPTNVIIQLQSSTGDVTGPSQKFHRPRRRPSLQNSAAIYELTRSPIGAGPQLDVPHDVTPSQLETLLNGLQQSDERLSYSFFIHEQELAAELGAHLLKHKVGRSVLFSDASH